MPDKRIALKYSHLRVGALLATLRRHSATHLDALALAALLLHRYRLLRVGGRRTHNHLGDLADVSVFVRRRAAVAARIGRCYGYEAQQLSLDVHGAV